MRHVITGISCVTDRKGQELIYLEESLHRALKDGGIEITNKNRGNIGIFLATTFSNFYIRKNTFDKLDKLGVRAVNPADFPRQLISYLGGYLSIKFGTKGAMSVLSSGQSSGLDALQQALFFLQRDKRNIAFVIDLDENWQEKSSSMVKAGVCFICENITSESRRKVYAGILRIENSFEKKNKNSGLCKCIKKTLEFCSSQTAIPRYFFSSQTSDSRKYILEKKALQHIYGNKKFKLLPAKNITNASLRAIYDSLKVRSSFHPRQENSAVSLFLNIGEHTNSVCMALRDFRA